MELNLFCRDFTEAKQSARVNNDFHMDFQILDFFVLVLNCTQRNKWIRSVYIRVTALSYFFPRLRRLIRAYRCGTNSTFVDRRPDSRANAIMFRDSQGWEWPVKIPSRANCEICSSHCAPFTDYKGVNKDSQLCQIDSSEIQLSKNNFIKHTKFNVVYIFNYMQINTIFNGKFLNNFSLFYKLLLRVFVSQF